MDNAIDLQDFLNALMSLLDETFENTHGIYLDKDTSLFHTFKEISAAQASIPVGGKCASLAAQVAHVNFYLEVLEFYVKGENPGDVDWGEIWRTVEKVSSQEWQDLQAKLHSTYERVCGLIRANRVWNEDTLSGAMAVVIHSAYHLGEIRQALCTLRDLG